MSEDVADFHRGTNLKMIILIQMNKVLMKLKSSCWMVKINSYALLILTKMFVLFKYFLNYSQFNLKDNCGSLHTLLPLFESFKLWKKWESG